MFECKGQAHHDGSESCMIMSLQKQSRCRYIHDSLSRLIPRAMPSRGPTQNAHARFAESKGVASRRVSVRPARDLVSGSENFDPRKLPAIRYIHPPPHTARTHARVHTYIYMYAHMHYAHAHTHMHTTHAHTHSEYHHPCRPVDQEGVRHTSPLHSWGFTGTGLHTLGILKQLVYCASYSAPVFMCRIVSVDECSFYWYRFES